MIQGGMTAVCVANLDRAVQFYTEVLGLTEAERHEDRWARIDAGQGYSLGLHVSSPRTPSPGSSGAISIGLQVTRRLDDVVTELGTRGVVFRGPVRDDGFVRVASFGDPDGNDLYLYESSLA